MRTLVRWAARLYPAAWRARYAVEMEALLEEVGPGGGDVWDVVRGALFMQMKSLGFWQIVSGCSLAGALAAGIWSATLPKRYVSTAVMRLTLAAPLAPGDAGIERKFAAQRHLAEMQQTTLSRGSLTSIIVGQNLYANERSKYPLEDIIQEMRSRDLRIYPTQTASGAAYAVEFTNENPAAAQATVRAIVTSLTEQNVLVSQRPGNGVANMAVLAPPSLPAELAGPGRMRAIYRGLGAGTLLGLVCGAISSIVRSKERWSMRRIGGFAAAGMALGLTIAFLIPDEFISTAVLRTADGGKLQSTIREVLSEDSVAAIIRQDHLFSRELSRGSMNDVVRKMRNERIRVQMLQTVQLQPSAMGSAFTISFRYPDRFQAQRVTRDLVARFMGAPQASADQPATEVLDPASLPEAPSSPNRPQIAVFGTVVGILLGLGASRFRRPKLAAA
jgi:hypothetical protein